MQAFGRSGLWASGFFGFRGCGTRPGGLGFVAVAKKESLESDGGHMGVSEIRGYLILGSL